MYDLDYETGIIFLTEFIISEITIKESVLSTRFEMAQYLEKLVRNQCKIQYKPI